MSAGAGSSSAFSFRLKRSLRYSFFEPFTVETNFGLLMGFSALEDRFPLTRLTLCCESRYRRSAPRGSMQCEKCKKFLDASMGGPPAGGYDYTLKLWCGTVLPPLEAILVAASLGEQLAAISRQAAIEEANHGQLWEDEIFFPHSTFTPL